MARPSKAVSVLTDEKKSHRTKAELKQRGQAERAALTGLPIRESPDVQSDAIAHIEFLRVTELLSAVDKNDALYESVINDYCMYKSDISRYMKMRSDIEKDDTIDAAKRYKLIVDCDRQAETYRKKRFDIEKENGFTIASAMRAIPKKVDQKKNPVMEVLCDDAD